MSVLPPMGGLPPRSSSPRLTVGVAMPRSASDMERIRTETILPAPEWVAGFAGEAEPVRRNRTRGPVTVDGAPDDVP